MTYSELRQLLIERAHQWAETVGAPTFLSKTGVVFFEPYAKDGLNLHAHLQRDFLLVDRVRPALAIAPLKGP